MTERRPGTERGPEPRGPAGPAPPTAPTEAHPPHATLGPTNLHPAGIALAALGSARELVVTFVAVVVLGSRSSELGPLMAVVVAVVGLGAAAAIGYLRWRAERYEVSDGAIRHRRGVISPDETVIPLARVHAIDTAAGPIQRLFGVHELHVQTAAGGSGGEIVLRAVTPAAADAVRGALGMAEAGATDRPEWRLTGRGLAATALTSPQLRVLVPIVGGAVALLDNVTTIEAGDGLGADASAGYLAMLAALALTAASAVSIAGSVVAFAGFSVTLEDDRLRIRRGLAQRRAASVPLARVHGIRIVEGPLRRPFGLCSVRIETIGYGREPAAVRTLFPTIPARDLDAALSELVPAFAGALGALERPPERARRRYALREAAPGLLLGALATVAWSWAWPAIPLLGILGALDGLYRHRVAGWRLDAGRLVLRDGSIARRTLVASAHRLQHHSLAQSHFQRRAALGTLSVTVGSGATGAVSHLELDTAASLFARLRRPRTSPPAP